jgi:predicted house-cleaning noncanonical NTP pyrophosphatase (MazG superfamily)
VKRIEARVIMIEQLAKHFDDTKTPPNMKEAVMLGFQAWINDQPIPDIAEIIPTSSTALRMAYKEQSEIGWDQMIRGRLSKRWAEFINHAQAQDAHEGYKTTTTTWGCDWICIIWKTMLILWNLRNQSVHGATKTEQATILKEKLMQKVASLKTKGDLQTTKDTEYLTLSEEKISNMNTGQIMTWISNIEALRKINDKSLIEERRRTNVRKDPQTTTPGRRVVQSNLHIPTCENSTRNIS